MLTPREGTDLQSEILDVIAPPMYVYTITSVYLHWIFIIVPYHYGGTYARIDTPAVSRHRAFLTLVYFEMMSNWLCARYVSNTCDSNRIVKSISQSKGCDLDSVYVDEKCQQLTSKQTNNVNNVTGTSRRHFLYVFVIFKENKSTSDSQVPLA